MKTAGFQLAVWCLPWSISNSQLIVLVAVASLESSESNAAPFPFPVLLPANCRLTPAEGVKLIQA